MLKRLSITTVLSVLLLLCAWSIPAAAAVTPTISVKKFPIWGTSQNITEGPDGNIWFGVYIKEGGRISPQGVVTKVPGLMANGYGSGITSGPDGNLWFSQYQSWIDVGIC